MSLVFYKHAFFVKLLRGDHELRRRRCDTMEFGALISGGLPMDAHLSSHHRDTIEKIFRHPASGNIEWREVLSLLEYLGATSEERNGKFTVALGPETEVFEAPRGKDIDAQMIVDLRRILRQAGFAPDGEAPT